jgi:2-keto-4-pentenoate hydratase/2-oxohepta-3-ene-1,7-dioic acid hydratase in catechol pathway
MKLVTYESDSTQRVAAVFDGRLVDLASITRPASFSGQPMIELLVGGAAALEAARAQLAEVQRHWQPEAHLALERARLLAPIPRPGKIVAIGRNYADHAAETGVKPFENPRIIAKLPSSVTGPGAVVRRPPGVMKLDYEIELGVVIGKRSKLVPRTQALDAVAGYTVLNDVSAREFQFDVAPAQTTFAKSMDDFCPMGPWIVTADEIPDPQSLALQLRVNDELLQDGSTHDMIFDVPHLIEYISRFITLEPGDVIATGTPAGVGAFRTPPRWLQPGDRLRLEISQVGVLEHSIG